MNAVKSKRYLHHAWLSGSDVTETFSKSVQFTSTALILSGLLHLSLFALGEANWEGAVSPRKPALFGLSTGLTVCSLAWCCRVLGSDRRFLGVTVGISWALLVEVMLITLQYWRGVPSHFNRSTGLDAIIELMMLALIACVTVGIAWTCWFSMKLFAVDVGKLLAIRAGLFFLLLSCLLGFATMFMGEYNLSVGQPVETWGRAGVLKYPHGAVLHALQILPILNWGLTKLAVPRRIGMLMCGVSSHLLFLFHAIWQTCHGRERLDVDFVGQTMLVSAVVMFFIPVVAILLCGLFRGTRSASRKSSSRSQVPE